MNERSQRKVEIFEGQLLEKLDGDAQDDERNHPDCANYRGTATCMIKTFSCLLPLGGVVRS